MNRLPRRRAWRVLTACAGLLGASGFGTLSTASAAGSAPAPRLLRDCPDCPELAVVPRGRFQMGSDDGEKGRPEGPVHLVRIRQSFALGRSEVTVGQFRRFVEQSGYQVAPGCRVQAAAPGPAGRVEWRDDASKGWRDPGFVDALREDHPVVCVGRVDALAYVEWLARTTDRPYRLPSESEWEYAARAGSGGLFDWGSNADNGCARANLYDRSARKHLDFGWSFVDCDRNKRYRCRFVVDSASPRKTRYPCVDPKRSRRNPRSSRPNASCRNASRTRHVT